MNPLREQLMANTDEEYRQFTLPLLPGIPADTVLGVRTPVLRKLAKEYKHTDTAAAFLQDLPHKYYEEVNLHTFLLAYEKDFARYMEELEKILPEVKCWASCDGIRNPILKKHTNELLPYITGWLASDQVYTVRLAISFLMAYYLHEAYDPSQLAMAVAVQGEEYYINMMIAWYLATAMIHHEKDVLFYLENNRLNDFVHRMTIRKAIESYRISDETKAYLRSLRRKGPFPADAE